MIELSIGILRTEPMPETTPLREWAIDVIDKRANFRFNAAQRAALLKKPLPFKPQIPPVYMWSPNLTKTSCRHCQRHSRYPAKGMPSVFATPYRSF
jgi:hypothetical protein